MMLGGALIGLSLAILALVYRTESLARRVSSLEARPHLHIDKRGRK